MTTTEKLAVLRALDRPHWGNGYDQTVRCGIVRVLSDDAKSDATRVALRNLIAEFERRVRSGEA